MLITRTVSIEVFDTIIELDLAFTLARDTDNEPNSLSSNGGWIVTDVALSPDNERPSLPTGSASLPE